MTWEEVPKYKREAVERRLRAEAIIIASRLKDRTVDQVHAHLMGFWKARPDQFPRAARGAFKPGQRVSYPLPSFGGPKIDEGPIYFILMELEFNPIRHKHVPIIRDCVVLLADGRFRRVPEAQIQIVLPPRKDAGPTHDHTQTGNAA